MNREQYIEFRKLHMLQHITYFYFVDRGLKMELQEFLNLYPKILSFITQTFGFNQQMMIAELDVHFEIVIVENIATGKIYKIM